MNLHRKTMFLLSGLAALGVTLLLIWCPPALCRVLNIHTFPLSNLNDFRQYVADEEAFYSLHHTRAVRIDCAALRDEVVTVLKIGHLVLETNTPGDTQRERRPGTIEAWHQGRLLHLTNTALASKDEQQAWATSVRAVVTLQQQQDLAFLSRLFGAVVLHVSHRQIPIVLFSDRPCL